MKVKINGSVSKDALRTILNTQKEKTKIIDEFVKNENIDDFYYQDNELEYQAVIKKTRKQPEVRKNESSNNETD